MHLHTIYIDDGSECLKISLPSLRILLITPPQLSDEILMACQRLVRGLSEACQRLVRGLSEDYQVLLLSYTRDEVEPVY